MWGFIPAHAARVNKKVITRSRLLSGLRNSGNDEYYRDLSRSGREAEARTVLEAMIDRILLEELFELKLIRVDREEVKLRFFEQRNRMTTMQRELLARRLRLQRMTVSEYAEAAADDPDTIFDLKLRKLAETLNPKALEISREDLETYYRERQSAFMVPASVNISRIRIAFDRELERLRGAGHQTAVVDDAIASAQTKMVAARDALAKSPDAFAGLVKQYGDGNEGLDDGSGTFIRGATLEAETEDQAFSLPPGSISGVIRSASAVQIIRVNCRVPEGYSSFEDVKGFIEEELGRAALGRLISRTLREARRKNEIEIFF